MEGTTKYKRTKGLRGLSPQQIPKDHSLPFLPVEVTLLGIRIASVFSLWLTYGYYFIMLIFLTLFGVKGGKMPEFSNPFSILKNDRNLTPEELVRAVRFMIAAEYEAVQLYQ